MGAKKIKPSKKVAAKIAPAQDTYVEQVKIWAEKNYSRIVIVGAAILFAVISAWGMNAYQTYSENSARSAYAPLASKLAAEGTMAPEEWQKLIPDLQKFISAQKGTQTALLAKVELAKAYFETKRYDDAIKTASEALKAIPPGHGLKPLIQYQLAYAYEAAGKPDQAVKEWTDLKGAGLAGLDREAQWNIGRIYAAGKDYARAAEMYAKAVDAPGSYPASALLEQELERTRQAAGIGEKQGK
ncbi:MAG: tetratricopeptide repeat protein [Syntrophobacteraceae bacterium]